MKLLSILIPTVHTRSEYLDRLMARLKPQLTDDVEVLIEASASQRQGGPSTGHKRNILVEKSCGDFLVHVDDDDKWLPGSVARILSAIQTRPDVVGITGIKYIGGKFHAKMIYSMRYKGWWGRNGVLYRCPAHLNPIQREIATRVPFPDRTQGEDRSYSRRIQPYLHTEVMIEEPIYRYDFRPSKPELRLCQS